MYFTLFTPTLDLTLPNSCTHFTLHNSHTHFTWPYPIHAHTLLDHTLPGLLYLAPPDCAGNWQHYGRHYME